MPSLDKYCNAIRHARRAYFSDFKYTIANGFTPKPRHARYCDGLFDHFPPTRGGHGKQRNETMRFVSFVRRRSFVLLFSLLCLSSLASSFHENELVYPSRKATKVLRSTVSETRLLNSNDRNSQDNGYNLYDVNDDDSSNIVDQARDRVTTDFSNMWVTSPSEWTDEYWEVLVIAYAIILLILFICCAPICCCCDDNGKGGRNIRVATIGDDKQEPMLQQGEPRTTSSGAVILPPIMSSDQNDDKNNMKSEGVAPDDGNVPSPRRHGSRRRRTLWGEVVSVWTEFFDDLMKRKKNKESSQYDYHLDDYDNYGSSSPSRRRQRRSSSRKRRSSQPTRGSNNDDVDMVETFTSQGSSTARSNSKRYIEEPLSSSSHEGLGVTSTLSTQNGKEGKNMGDNVIQTTDTPYDEFTDHDEEGTPLDKYQGTMA